MKKCKEVMTGFPVCCVPTDTAASVAKLMKTENVGSLPVCEHKRSKKLVGIVTDRDLVLHVEAQNWDASSTKVQDVMTCQPFTCRAEDDLQIALDATELHQVRRVPVVDHDGQLIGIVAQADVATRSGERLKIAEMVEEISRASLQAV